MQPLQQIYVGMVILSFLSSLTSFRLDTPFHLRYFSLLLGLTVLVEITSGILNYLRINNWWLYSVFVLIEFPAYAWFYLQIIPAKRWQWIIKIFLVIFPIFWAAFVYIKGIRTWPAMLVTVGSFFCVLFSLMYYHRIITAPSIIELRSLPEFWIATGMLIFYLGSCAFFGMMNIILRNLEIAAKLSKVYLVLNIMMYSFFTIGFLCRIVNIKKFSSS